MKEMIYKELDRSQHELFTQEELTPILVSIKLSRSQADENIGIDYWMNVLNTYAEYGEDVTDHSDKLLELSLIHIYLPIGFSLIKHRPILPKG